MVIFLLKMKTIINLSEEKIGEVIIPSISITQGQMTRIVFRKKENCIKAERVFTGKVNNKLTSVRTLGKNAKRKNLFTAYTVDEYLNKNGDLSAENISDFVSKIRVESDQKIDSLQDGVQEAVFLKSISTKKGVGVLLFTAGMYLDALVATYETLKTILDNGGACLELTYPDFQDSELDSFLGVIPTVIHVGKGS